mmetsp:Transcript_10999/g.16558  ORF Transcript_10999/g.16558 Transcript_10999/m.16558 type:complete len:408 (-) Transcript_10999:189-1412(-)
MSEFNEHPERIPGRAAVNNNNALRGGPTSPSQNDRERSDGRNVAAPTYHTNLSRGRSWNEGDASADESNRNLQSRSSTYPHQGNRYLPTTENYSYDNPYGAYTDYSGHQAYPEGQGQYYVDPRMVGSAMGMWQGNESNNYETDDYDNLEEIERELHRVQIGYSASSDANYQDEEDDIEAEIEAEIAFVEHQQQLQQQYQYQNQNNHYNSRSNGQESSYNGNRGGYAGAGAPRGGGSGVLPIGATPSRNGVLSPHAAEFWFPESRQCPCCKGFKHGCSCRSRGVDTCMDPACTDPNAQQSVASKESSAAAPVAPSSTANPAETTSYAGSYIIEPPREVYPTSAVEYSPKVEYCRFESSASGCRNGSTCRFPHRGFTDSNFNQQRPPPCSYFMIGKCEYGDSCKFSHQP